MTHSCPGPWARVLAARVQTRVSSRQSEHPGLSLSSAPRLQPRPLALSASRPSRPADAQAAQRLVLAPSVPLPAFGSRLPSPVSRRTEPPLPRRAGLGSSGGPCRPGHPAPGSHRHPGVAEGPAAAPRTGEGRVGGVGPGGRRSAPVHSPFGSDGRRSWRASSSSSRLGARGSGLGPRTDSSFTWGGAVLARQRG